jgi:hypothetical protein
MSICICIVALKWPGVNVEPTCINYWACLRRMIEYNKKWKSVLLDGGFVWMSYNF